MSVKTPSKKRTGEHITFTPNKAKGRCIEDNFYLRNPDYMEEESIEHADNAETNEKNQANTISVRRINLCEVVSENCIISEKMENVIYHYKFQIESFTNGISFGYCKNIDKVEGGIPNIAAKEGDIYEVIYDMINKRMSIRQGNNTVETICRINSTPVYPYLGATNCSVKFLGCSKIPLSMIKRYTIRDYKINTTEDKSCNVVNYRKYSEELYKYDNNSSCIIQYVVCNEVLKDESNGKYCFKINEEMKENSGIYHFYFEIKCVGNENISFGYTIGGETEPIKSSIRGRKGEIYEVTYNMNEKIMYIKQGNGIGKKVFENLPTSIYPCISIGSRKGSVKLKEYYLEKENYQLLNVVNVENGEAVMHGINVPNTIYSIYNYEKYYWISELLSIKDNITNIDLERIKYEIEYRFILNKEQRDYLNNSDVNDLITKLKYLHDENENYLDLPDNFVKIVNNLSIIELPKLDEDGKVVENDEKKYLDFTHANMKVFQFPKNIIYIRDSYYSMFRDICKILSHDAIKKIDIVITGQPGIGKTSFIYVLLYFLKSNLSYDYEEEEKKNKEAYLLIKNKLNEIQLNKEKQEIQEFLNVLYTEKEERKRPLPIVIEQLNKDIQEKEKNITIFENNITTAINRIKTIYDKDVKHDDLYTYKKCSYTLKICDTETHIKHRPDLTETICEGKYNSNTEEIKHLNDLLEKIVGKKELEDFYKWISNNNSNDDVICKHVITDRILNRLNNIEDTIESIELYKSRITEIENEINRIEEEYEKTKEEMENRIVKLEDDINKIKDVAEVNEEDLGIGFNYYLLDACKKMKSIYFVKGKKDGNPTETRIYKFEKINGEYILCKSKKTPDEIRGSLIIVDTYNRQFNPTNIIISISSPDKRNNDEYKEGKELYFDSLNKTEIVEWFVNCIGFDIPRSDDGNSGDGFKEICKKYGYIPRQIYYHYLYKENYNGDYWEYYKQLIESVVGTTGYIQFVNDYMKKDKLKELSNIILKYDLEKVWDNDVRRIILKPKDYLKFISEDIEKYIVCKFNPPKDEEEYHKVEKYYTSTNDKNMRRMALKQIIAYELSTGMIKFNYKDPNFKMTSKLYIPVYHPPKAKNFVYYILDDNNFFDLIMDGVFIKVLLNNEIIENDDKTNEKIKESIKKYSKEKSDEFMYCMIQNREVNGYTTISILPPAKSEEDGEEEQKQNEGKEEQKQDINTIVLSSMNVYMQDNNVYLVRDCFYKILNVIFPQDLDFETVSQRNYLIFGHSKIGKSTFADIIREYIHNLYPDVSILHEIEKGNLKTENIDYYDKRKKYQIVISDEAVIGEDDYADAKMVILLANPSKEEYKTFQSKRCPSIMYIPQFTKEEVEKVGETRFIEVRKLNGMELDITYKGFTNSADINNKNSEKVKYRSSYEEWKKLYEKKYPLYKGVIGLYYDKNSEYYINSSINNEKNKVIIEEILKGIDKSPFSKGEYDNMLIYDTYEDENGIFKSNRLIFISEEMKKMVCDTLFKINDKNSCERMMKLLIENPVGGLAGILYERIISCLMKYCNPFYESLSNDIQEYYLDDKKKNKYIAFTGKYTKISNDDDLMKEITTFNNYYERKEFHITDLSYNPSFPDVDMLLGPYGIQITVGNSHTLALEMIMILQNLYGMFFKSSTSIDNSSPYGLFYITPNNEVSIRLKTNRKISKYPTFFQPMTYKTDKYKLFEEAKAKIITISFKYEELKYYLDLLQDKDFNK